MRQLAGARFDACRLRTSAAHPRAVDGLRITPYDIPPGSAGGYYPECNPLMPLAHHAEKSKVPAAKSIPIRLRRSALSVHA